MTSLSMAGSNGLRRTLDKVERIVVVLLYMFLLYRFAEATIEQPANALYLVTEGVVMLMILLRRGTDQISIRPADWFVAFAGTFLAMAIVPAAPVPGTASLAVGLLLGGLLVSLAAKLQLRRSFGLVAANRGIKTKGVYAWVRHPMYLGYFLSQTGVVMLNFNIWNVMIVATWALLQIMRIQAEERMLMQDSAYRVHAKQVRARLIPGVY